jgi:hypothetical protein
MPICDKQPALVRPNHIPNLAPSSCECLAGEDDTPLRMTRNL